MTRRYLFLLSTTRALHYRIRGLRQLVTIGVDPNTPSTPSTPNTPSPTWTFLDGEISWSLLRKPKRLKRK